MSQRWLNTAPLFYFFIVLVVMLVLWCSFHQDNYQLRLVHGKCQQHVYEVQYQHFLCIQLIVGPCHFFHSFFFFGCSLNFYTGKGSSHSLKAFCHDFHHFFIRSNHHVIFVLNLKWLCVLFFYMIYNL